MRREIIEEYYNYYIDEIIKPYILEFGEARWLRVDELHPMRSKKRIPWEEKKSDGYIIRSSKDKSILAMDIAENGTYWPFFITETGEVMMGSHRLEALQEIGYHKPVLCIVLNENHFDKSRTDKTKYEYRNPVTFTERTYRVPGPIEIPEDSIRRGDEYIIFKTNKWDRSEKFADFEANNYRDMMDILRITPHWLKDYMFIEEESGKRIPSRGCVNDIEEFEKWIKNSKGE